MKIISLICGVETLGLLDSGSRITSISEAFYETLDPKIVSEYDQEILQSQTADKPMAPRGRYTQQSRDIRKTI